MDGRAFDADTAEREAPSPARPRQAPSLQRAALQMCAGVIAGSPEIAEIPARDTLITTRWVHPALHEEMPALPVHVVATYYGPPVPRLWHWGKMRFSATGRPGSVAVVPREWGGRWDIDGSAPLSYVFLSHGRLQEFADQSLARVRDIELLPCLAEPDPIGSQLLRALSRHAANPDNCAGLFVEQALDLLCMHLIRTRSALANQTPPAARRGLLTWQVRRITAYMREHLDRTIGLDELAAQVNLSRFHFCTAFRQATGRTPHEWLVSLRMERARQLLADPRLSVTAIALAVGYKTPSAFTASFRKSSGVTPSEFRHTL